MTQNNHEVKDGARAVLWDLDGTLIDSADDHWITWREALAPEGIELTRDQLISLLGTRNDLFLKEIFGREIPLEKAKKLSLQKEDNYRTHIRKNGAQLYPGAVRWIKKLKHDGWRQMVASSAPKKNIEAVLEATELGNLMDGYISADEVGHGKPDPEIFVIAAQRIGVPIERCIVVEDAHVGIEAARNAGMANIGVLTIHPELDADIVVNSLEDLPEDAFQRLLAQAAPADE